MLFTADCTNSNTESTQVKNTAAVGGSGGKDLKRTENAHGVTMAEAPIGTRDSIWFFLLQHVALIVIIIKITLIILLRLDLKRSHPNLLFVLPLVAVARAVDLGLLRRRDGSATTTPNLGKGVGATRETIIAQPALPPRPTIKWAAGEEHWRQLEGDVGDLGAESRPRVRHGPS